MYDALYNRRRRADNVVVKPKFKIGDRVRILKKNKTFGKGFTPNFDRRSVHCEYCQADKTYHL